MICNDCQRHHCRSIGSCIPPPLAEAWQRCPSGRFDEGIRRRTVPLADPTLSAVSRCRRTFISLPTNHFRTFFALEFAAQDPRLSPLLSNICDPPARFKKFILIKQPHVPCDLLPGSPRPPPRIGVRDARRGPLHAAGAMDRHGGRRPLHHPDGFAGAAVAIGSFLQHPTCVHDNYFSFYSFTG